MSLPLPPLSPTAPSTASADSASLLLKAVHQRDEAATVQLLLRWVHRHGLESLEGFCHTTLTTQEGPEASAWLRERIDTPRSPSSSAPPVAADPQLAEDLPAEQTLSDRPAHEPPQAVAPQAPEATVSGMPSVISTPIPEQAGSEILPAQESAAGAGIPAASDGSPTDAAAIDPSVRLEVAAIDPWLKPAERLPVASSIESGVVEAAVPALEEPPELEEDIEAALEHESAPVSGGLRGLGRLGSMVWNSLESLGRPRNSDGGVDDAEPESPASLLETPGEGPDPMATAQADSLPSDPLPASVGSAIPPNRASLPPMAPSHRPAPSPASLNDLRSWLPDSKGTKEYPRAS